MLDTLQNSGQYETFHPLFAGAFEHLRELASREELSDGRVDVDGDRIYAVVVRGSGKQPENISTETHRRYIDIQYTAEGVDRIGWLAAADCRLSKGYNSNKDLELYSDSPTTWLDVGPGQFAIFFPSDAHAPMTNAGQPVLKIVMKVAV